ncbi:hypothetical protein ACWA7J_02025 [Leptothrix sp. BB-4]
MDGIPGYSWEDLAPVREVWLTMMLFHGIGGVLGVSGVLGLSGPDPFSQGTLLGSLPGFLVGLVVQQLCRPGSLGLPDAKANLLAGGVFAVWSTGIAIFQH